MLPSELIIVAGSGRSGAVALADVIAGDECRTLFEPLDERQVPELAGLGLRPYFRPDGPYPEWQEKLKPLLAGEIKNQWVDKDLRGFDPAKSTGVTVVKEIRANGILGWLDRKFNCKIVYLLRHPCAVVASRIKLGWETHLETLLVQKELVEDYLTPYLGVIRGASSVAEKHAVMWCVENLVPLRQMRDFSWTTCFYEELLGDPEKLREVVALLDLEFTESRKRAADAFCTKASGERRQPAKWVEALSEEEKRDIERIVRAMNIDVYDINEVMPLAPNPR